MIGLQGFLYSKYLILSHTQDAEKKEIFHVSFFSFKNAAEDTNTISSL